MKILKNGNAIDIFHFYRDQLATLENTKNPSIKNLIYPRIVELTDKLEWLMNNFNPEDEVSYEEDGIEITKIKNNSYGFKGIKSEGVSLRVWRNPSRQRLQAY